MNTINHNPYVAKPIIDTAGIVRCIKVEGPNLDPAYYGAFKKIDAEVFAYTLNQAFKAGLESVSKTIQVSQKPVVKKTAVKKVTAKKTA